MTTLRPVTTAALLGFAVLTGCDTADGHGPDDGLTVDPSAYTKGGATGKADASVEAIVVDFEFDGQLRATSSFDARGKIEDQLLYTIGHLNGDNSVGRLDKLELTEITTTNENGMVVIRYHAKLPVAWGDRDDVPASYEFTLPADVSFAGQQAFTEKYSHTCVELGAHDVTPGSMWYYFRPARSGCTFEAGDVFSATADLEVSPVNTTGKYPEYHRVWEDEMLSVVAVFGKYEDGATSNTDAGISAYNRFTRAVQTELAPFSLTVDPPAPSTSPGVAMPELNYVATLPDGRAVHVTAILVDNVRTAGAAFNARYAALTPEADLIVYNGHAGLGANIRALAQKGHWVQGQYAMVFMNGCDTYAYVDSALAQAHSNVNPDDPNGTKYLDIITNAMPSFFNQMPNGSMALMRGLMSYDDPQTYEQMFLGIDADEVVLVSGEQDNEFVPGFGEGDDEPGTDAWPGLTASDTVARNEEHRFTTPTLAPGQYEFVLTGNGDADLYVRTGLAPTVADFECRPYRSGSDETCVLSLSTPAEVHVMVRGWNPSSDYTLVGGTQ